MIRSLTSAIVYAHPERIEDVLLHVAEVVLAGGALDDRAQHAPAVARVVVLLAGFEQQRVGLKDGEPLEHRLVVAGVVDLRLDVPFVVPNARQMAGKLACRNGVRLLRKRRDVFLDRRIQVQLALLVQQAERGRRDRLGHAPDAHLGGRPHGLALLEIRKAEAFGPDDSAVDEDRDAEAGRAAGALTTCAPPRAPRRWRFGIGRRRLWRRQRESWSAAGAQPATAPGTRTATSAGVMAQVLPRAGRFRSVSRSNGVHSTPRLVCGGSSGCCG